MVFLMQDTYSLLEQRPFTFKWGVNDDAFRDYIDYIFYTPNTIDVEWMRDTLTKEEKEKEKEWGIPNLNHPSDHFPQVARFILKK